MQTLPNLVHIRGYKLPISGQNLAQRGLAQAEMLLVAFLGEGVTF